MEAKRLVVLGSTGSIGMNCLEVARQFPSRLQIVGLSAHSKISELLDQIDEFRPRWVAITDQKSFDSLDRVGLPKGTEVLFGEDAIARMVSAPDTDIVLSAIVGAAGLMGTWQALEAGKSVALANKESLVVAGRLVMDIVQRKNLTLLPVDSEHSAIFQAMGNHGPEEVERIVLTASGGPFRGKNRGDLISVTPEQALRHPTWKMGPKITVDSATLMNKALEIIEAHWLFSLTADQIEVIVHPESVVHSFVEFRDGSVLAQLSPPDMKLPIQYALLYPDRPSGPARRMRWSELQQWTFEQPDRKTFESLDLAGEVIRGDGTCGAILNAANEVAVERFLAGEIAFLDIARLCRDVLHGHDHVSRPSLTELMAADRQARLEGLRWRSQ